MSLNGQVALVVGGASGIGLSTARLLLQHGANVTVCDVSAAGDVVKELQTKFGVKRCLFAQADVREEAQLEAAFTDTKNTFKRLDIVINSAGISNDLNWKLLIDVNLKGVMCGTLLAWKHMGKHEGGNGGVVVNIASIFGLMAMHVCPAYTASKHAVIGFSRSCGEVYHRNRTGVRVIAMCPGFTETPIVKNAKLMSEDLNEELKKQITSFPMQKVDNVASAIMQVIQHGDSGSVWVSEEDKPAYQLEFPWYKKMRLNK